MGNPHGGDGGDGDNDDDCDGGSGSNDDDDNDDDNIWGFTVLCVLDNIEWLRQS